MAASMHPLAKMLATGAAAAVLAAPMAAAALTYKPGLLQRGLGKPSELKAAWKPLSQPEGVPKVKYGRSYVFMTHHKTGTNLMRMLCNYTAQILSGGKDECAWCLRVRAPDEDGYLQCADPRSTGTFNRFTLVSSIDEREFELIRKYAPDFKAIHMIREPIEMTISAYKYEMCIHSEECKKMRNDTLVDVSKEKSIDDQVRAEAWAMLDFLNEMLGVHEKGKEDDRVLELDLDAFEVNYEDAARRLWLHLLEDVSDAEMQTWLKSAESQDTNRWGDEAKAGNPQVAASQFISSAEAKRAWQRLEEAGDEAALSVRAFSKPMGYDVAGKPWGRGAAGAVPG